MAFPVLDVASLGLGFAGDIMARSEARHRERAMRIAAKRMYLAQSRDFNSATGMVRADRSRYESDPRRAALGQAWDKKLANPVLYDPATISLLKAKAMDTIGADTATGIGQVRAQAQRRGVAGSGFALASEAAMRSRSAGATAAASNNVDLATTQANKTYGDSVRAGYERYLSEDSDRLSGFTQQLTQLLGSKQYGESAMLAFM